MGRRQKEVADPGYGPQTPLHPSPPAGARAQQGQFRGRKTVSKLSSDLYFFRAFWLMKYETNIKPQQQMPVRQSS